MCEATAATWERGQRDLPGRRDKLSSKAEQKGGIHKKEKSFSYVPNLSKRKPKTLVQRERGGLKDVYLDIKDDPS